MKEDLEAQRAERAAEKKKAEKEAAEERIEKIDEANATENTENTDGVRVVSSGGTVSESTSIDVVVDTVTPSTGTPKIVGGEVDVKA